MSSYLAASSASAYSMVSMVQHFGKLMGPGGSCVSLTFVASERVVPGYGGGMSSAKAQLESDTKVLDFNPSTSTPQCRLHLVISSESCRMETVRLLCLLCSCIARILSHASSFVSSGCALCSTTADSKARLSWASMRAHAHETRVRKVSAHAVPGHILLRFGEVGRKTKSAAQW